MCILRHFTLNFFFGWQQFAVYRVHWACKLASFIEFGMKDQTEASFIIPEMKKWSANEQVGDLTVILGDLTVILASNGTEWCVSYRFTQNGHISYLLAWLRLPSKCFESINVNCTIGEAKGASGENCLLRDHDELGSIPGEIILVANSK